jgi:hypothetical protein
MQIPWSSLWQKSRKPLKTGWLITAGIIAVYIGALQRLQYTRAINSERATGLAASTEWKPQSYWRQSSISSRARGVVGGVPGGIATNEEGSVEMASVDALPVPPPPPKNAANDRKTIRNGAMDLIVKNPRDSSETIRRLVDHVGGFLVSSEISGSQDDSTASLTIRVPANRFEEARAEIRRLGLRVESEKLEAQDVTKQYVDQSARLRNLHAQERQYLGILKQAKTVRDTLEVSDKLNEVSGEIEQQQAEFDVLSKQVETVALTISLRAEADAKVFGLSWRPLYQFKLAARQGLDSLGDYAATMASFFFYLPTVLLWLGTILLGAALGWRILHWAGRMLFVSRNMAVTEKAVN